jgi:hypothetical protein
MRRWYKAATPHASAAAKSTAAIRMKKTAPEGITVKKQAG